MIRLMCWWFWVWTHLGGKALLAILGQPGECILSALQTRTFVIENLSLTSFCVYRNNTRGCKCTEKLRII